MHPIILMLLILIIISFILFFIIYSFYKNRHQYKPINLLLIISPFIIGLFVILMIIINSNNMRFSINHVFWQKFIFIYILIIIILHIINIVLSKDGRIVLIIYFILNLLISFLIFCIGLLRMAS
jgi:hypothetical protein